MIREPAVRDARADLAQMGEKVRVVVHLARCTKRAERFVADAVNKKTREPPIGRPRPHQLLEERDRRHLAHEAELKPISPMRSVIARYVDFERTIGLMPITIKSFACVLR